MSDFREQDPSLIRKWNKKIHGIVEPSQCVDCGLRYGNHYLSCKRDIKKYDKCQGLNNLKNIETNQP
jgi:hypothetical protein